MQPLTFESDDLGETEEFLSRAYAPLRIGGRGEQRRARVERVGDESASVDVLDIGFEMSYDVEALGRVAVTTVHHGTFRDHRIDGWHPAGNLGAGDTFLLAVDDRGYSGQVVAARYTLTMFDADLLDQVAQTAPDAGEEPIRITDYRPRSAAAAHQLEQAVQHLATTVLVDPVAAHHPLVVSSAERYLAACALAAFPNTALLEPTAQDRSDATSPTLRRAKSFIEANPQRDLTIRDIARAAAVTPRALQLAFRRHLGTTPMAYLRQVRLREARLELQRADPFQQSVGVIAASWGFGDASRFTRLYRTTFGELPSQTLRN